MGYRDSFEDLVGKTITKITDTGDQLRFECADESEYVMSHTQDCCESVNLEEVVGDLDDLLDTPVLEAYEVSNGDDTSLPCEALNEWDESYTWTFYRITTIKGTVTFRWYGTSNGYYSESVDFVRVN